MLFPIVPSAVRAFSTLVQINGTLAQNPSDVGYTFLTKIPTSLITKTGTKVRIVIDAGGNTGTLNNVTIGPAATSGNAYNCSSVTAVPRAGSAAWTVTGPLGTELISDEVTFSVTGAQALIVGFNQGSTPGVLSQRSAINSGSGAVAGVLSYIKAGTQEADDAARSTGYSAFSNLTWFIRRIEVQ